MLAKVCSATVNSIEVYPVDVEVNAGFGDTLIVIVGFANAFDAQLKDYFRFHVTTIVIAAKLCFNTIYETRGQRGILTYSHRQST